MTLMPPAVYRDYAFGQAYLPRVRWILGHYLFREATWEQDAREATDLIVLKAEAIRIGVRIRRPAEADKANYRNEFTIRCERTGGVKTELAKIADGWGDYLFYGFARPDAPNLRGGLLGDLDVFRRWRLDRLAATGKEPGEMRHNLDGSSSFRVYKIAQLPSPFIIARKPCMPGPTTRGIPA